uniref:TF-B3 domain-containing protein n=1 Tax=Oryza glumipatula TaxID=40148 RepID=A0A0D9YKK6_9ORYZ
MGDGNEVIDISSDSDDGQYGPRTFSGFDKYCWYGNDVTLTKSMHLQIAHVAAVNLPKIPLFVCTVKRTLMTNAKMTFAVQFSERYINKYIGSPIDDLMVSMAGTTQSYQMRLKRSKDSRAMLTTGWNQLIDAKAFDEGDVCPFHFKEVDDVLVLKITQLRHFFGMHYNYPKY